MKKVIFVLTLLPFLCFSQTNYYPGGLGSSNLQIWFKADTGVNYSSSTNVSSWIDQSPIGNNISQLTLANQPTLNSNFSNGMPGINFDASNQEWLQTSSSPGNGIFNTEGSIFICVENHSTGSWRGIVTQGRNTSDWWGFWTNPNWVFGFNGGNSSGGAAGSSPTILSGIQQAGTNNNIVYVNGTNRNSQNSINAGNSAQLAIGRALGINEYFDGIVGEVLIYDTYINNTERTIIENYFNTRYNISISNDKYAQPTPTTFISDLVGIGRQNATDNLFVSGSSGGLIIENSSFLIDNNDYILAAYNGSSVTGNTSSDNLNGGLERRWENEWFIDITDVNDNGGNVIIKFDFSDYGTGGIGILSNYQLLYRTAISDPFFSVVTSASSSISGDQIIFEVDALNLDDGYYTLGSSSIDVSPLPIELIDFTAKVKNESSIQLDWATESETNNSYFSVERSKDGIAWHTIKRMEGAGNSNSIINYSTFDYSPLIGSSYYRLKQTDFDGKFSYSEMVRIEFKTNTAIQITPNPAGNQITVISNNEKLKTVEIFSSQGVNLTSMVKIINVTDKSQRIDLSKLSPGAYLISTNNHSQMIIKE